MSRPPAWRDPAFWHGFRRAYLALGLLALAFLAGLLAGVHAARGADPSEPSPAPSFAPFALPPATPRPTAAAAPQQPAPPSGTGPGQARRPTPKPSAAPSPSPRLVRGLASWYRWRPGEAAAGPALRAALGPSWRGTRVIVTAGGLSVPVRLTDACQCYGTRLIDLDRDAFARLDDPSLGLVEVAVSW